jgi:hypothetical protein
MTFITDREIKTYHGKQKLKQFMAIKPVLQKFLKGILHTEEKSKGNEEKKFLQMSRKEYAV